MLVYFDPWMAGVVLPSMIIVGLMAMPYIDTNKAGNGYYTISQRKFAYITFQYGFLVLWVILILLGTFLRGPNWNFFGPVRVLGRPQADPAEQRQPLGHLLGPAPRDEPADEHPGPRAAGHPRRAWPTSSWSAAAPGPALLQEDTSRRGAGSATRSLAVLLLFMASLPIKMVLRWTHQPEVPGRDPGILLQHLI